MKTASEWVLEKMRNDGNWKIEFGSDGKFDIYYGAFVWHCDAYNKIEEALCGAYEGIRRNIIKKEIKDSIYSG